MAGATSPLRLHPQLKKLLGSKALILGLVSNFQVGFKCAFIDQPGLTQLHTIQPAISVRIIFVLDDNHLIETGLPPLYVPVIMLDWFAEFEKVVPQ